MAAASGRRHGSTLDPWARRALCAAAERDRLRALRLSVPPV